MISVKPNHPIYNRTYRQADLVNIVIPLLYNLYDKFGCILLMYIFITQARITGIINFHMSIISAI